MKLPTEIRVGYRKIKVELYDFYDDTQGVFLDHKSTIRIDQDLEQQVRAETFLHELLHTIFRTSMVGLPMKEEERVIRAISPFLLQFINDHPEVIADMRKALK